MVELESILENVKYIEKVLKSDFKDHGEYPIIDQSENFIAGFYDNKDYLFRISKPVICFGDHTRALKYINFNFVLGADGVKVLQTTDDVNTKYLYYCLKNIDIPSLGYSRHFKVLKELKIPLPPIESYQKIIDGARQIVGNYKPTIKINPDWEMVEMGDVCDVRDGTHESPKYEQSGYPLITSKNIKDGVIDFTNVNFLSEKDYTSINNRSKVDRGDIIMPMIGTIGNPIVVEIEPNFAIKNVALIKFYKNSKVLNYFTCLILSSKYFDNFLDNTKRGGTQKFISLKDIRGFKIPLPPLETQQQIVAQISKEQKAVDECKKLIAIFEQKIKDKISEVWGE